MRGDASCIKNHVMPYWADWEMHAITRMDIQSWIRSLVEKGAGAAAIKRAYNLTSSIMGAAVDDDVITVSPCRSIDLLKIAVQPPQWFTLDQAQSVLDELPSPWRTMCLLGFYTGLRWGGSWWRSTLRAASRSTRRVPRAAGKFRCHPMSWRHLSATSTG
ncbi:hypothetical protein [Streptomyces sp. NPDC006193]|uniref:hypothetical protein n=1 Tax=Streptomyces sp. NPDC006193 TaxID=3155717 RepID=UPI0033A7D915